MSELTYILGAGASYQSIPVVKNFNWRLRNFKNYLSARASSVYENDRINYNEAVYAIGELEREFSTHHSFDTYFKKLFHLNKTSEINNGKRLLNLYFLWEHSISSMVKFDENESMQDAFKKQSQFDKRYDALIAGLLKPDSKSAQPICKVNFVTWNYDINLLHSIKNFFYPELCYSEFLQKITKNQFAWEIGEQIKIINVNGFFYSNKLDNLFSLADFNAELFIDKMVFSGYHIGTDIDIDADKIRFSWELSVIDSKSLTEYLNAVITTSNNVVVIGYTFPLYNRFVDLDYLKQSEIVKKNIFIQNPDADILKQNFLDYYQLNGDKTFKEKRLFSIKNCESFYVPSGVFGIKEYQEAANYNIQ